MIFCEVRLLKYTWSSGPTPIVFVYTDCFRKYQLYGVPCPVLVIVANLCVYIFQVMVQGSLLPSVPRSFVALWLLFGVVASATFIIRSNLVALGSKKSFRLSVVGLLASTAATLEFPDADFRLIINSCNLCFCRGMIGWNLNLISDLIPRTIFLH